MPVPIRNYDMKQIVARMRSIPDEEAERMLAESERKGREDLLEWLSRYDGDGKLRPESGHVPKHDAEKCHSWWIMTPEEKAAYIVAEKKRLGVWP